MDAEQVADLALDLVDNDLLAGMEPIDLSIVGQLRLNSVDNLLNDICSLRDNVLWGIAAKIAIKNFGRQMHKRQKTTESINSPKTSAA